MKKILAAAGIGAALIAGPLVGAGAATATSSPAHADSLGFLQALNNSGIPVYNAGTALQIGNLICSKLNYETGTQVVNDVYLMYSDVPNTTMASVWAMDAVFTLCPWQYHPNQLNQTV